MTDNDSQDGNGQPGPWAERLQSIGVDWWATIVAGVIVALAVADVLPKIPW